MDLIDLLIGVGAFAASLILIVLLLVQGAGMLGALLADEHEPTLVD